MSGESPRAMRRVLVVIPALNEVRNIASVLESLWAGCDAPWKVWS